MDTLMTELPTIDEFDISAFIQSPYLPDQPAPVSDSQFEAEYPQFEMLVMDNVPYDEVGAPDMTAPLPAYRGLRNMGPSSSTIIPQPAPFSPHLQFGNDTAGGAAAGTDQIGDSSWMDPTAFRTFGVNERDVETEATQENLPIRSRKRKARTLRADAWEPYKERIIELHVTHGLPLWRVREEMQKEFGFSAEERQYRTRITQWGVDKNVKPTEMKAIVRKQQHRKLVEPAKRNFTFTVRGHEVDGNKIERWMKRNEVPEDLLYAPSPMAATPAAVGCRTISERGSPVPFGTPFHPPEDLLLRIQSPTILSPALSISSTATAQGSPFGGQSPAPIYRTPHTVFQASFEGDAQRVRLPISREAPELRYRQKEEEILRQNLAEKESLFDTPQPETLDTMFQLSVILCQQGRFKSAEDFARQILEARRAAKHDDNDVGTLDALMLFAEISYWQGQYSKAEKLHRRVLQSRTATLGERHAFTAKSMVGLAHVHNAQCLWHEAEELFTKAHHVFLNLYGTEHTETLIAMDGLARTCAAQGQFEKSEQLAAQVAEIGSRVLGNDHLLVLEFFGNLAYIYRRTGRVKQAEELATQVLERQKRVFGAEHPRTLLSLNNLAVTYRLEGRFEEAEKLHSEVLAVRKRVLGPQHPHTWRSMTDLAMVYRSLERFQEAEELDAQVEKLKGSWIE